MCGDRGYNGLDLCHSCRQELPTVASRCYYCANPLPSECAHGALCGHCQTEPPAFQRCLAPFAYAAPLDHLLQDLKFNSRLALARSLGILMADWLQEHIGDPPDCIIPVPLHAARLRERGFNQSLELARPIARRLHLPLDTHRCRRLRNTPPQADLTARHRHSNIKGAFGVTEKISGHIAIIDDVMTTGSTAQEMSRILLDAGAAEVEVWVCARAGSD